MLKGHNLKALLAVCVVFGAKGSAGALLREAEGSAQRKGLKMIHQNTSAENGGRFTQIVNYDDQRVGGTSVWTTDYEYTRKADGGKFHPNSPLHVPDSDPLQEQYQGVHAYENELFRVGDSKNDDKGIRVASGLSVDEKETQRPASNPDRSKNTAGMVPLCRFYRNTIPALNEWVGTEKWTVVTDLGVQRLTVQDFSSVSQPANLILRGHACNAATISVNVRLDSDTAAGVVFRSESDTNKYTLLLDTSRKVATLSRFIEGKRITIAEATISYLNSDMRHKIEVVDHGVNGKITVYLDGRTIFSQSLPFNGIGNMGILIEKGNASFDNFALSP